MNIDMRSIKLLGYLCFLGLAHLMALPLSAQDFKEDMKKMSGFYHNNDFSLEVNLNIISARVGSMSRKAILQKSGKNLYYELDKTKMFYSDEVSLLINDAEKDIVLRKVTPKEFELALNGAVQVNIDSLVSKYDSVNFVQGDKYKTYTIYTSKSVVSKTVIKLDVTDYSIREMEYFYNKAYTGEVTKTVAVFSDYTSSKRYTTDSFVTKTGDKFQLTSAYNKYTLILADTK